MYIYEYTSMVMVRAAISHFLHRTGVHRATRTYGYVILKIPTRRDAYFIKPKKTSNIYARVAVY